MNPGLRIYIPVLLLCICAVHSSFGQRPGQPPRDPNQNPIGSSQIEDTLASGVLPLDTPVAMKYVLMAEPDFIYTFEDSFGWGDAKHFPLSFHEAHLGNYGSASRSLTPSLQLRTGFSTGWDQYDTYYVHADSFPYYHQSVPVAKIKYSQSGQKNTYVSLDFGRSFARGFNLSFSYDRSNQLGEFAYQRQTNTALGLGVWHDAPSGKYDAFYNFISNAAVAEENGGISQLIDSLIPDELEFLPVFILSGLTTHKHRVFTTKQILHLIPDTTSFGIDIWMQAHFSTGLYKFVDDGTSLNASAPSYYSTYLIDSRGIRQFTFEKEYLVAGGISLPWRAASSTLHTSLRYRNIILEQEPEQRKLNELFWDASAAFHWIDPLELKGSMSFGLGQASGSFLFKAEGILHTGLLGNFEGSWSILTRRPYLIEERLFINQQLVYSLDLQNPFTTELGVKWNWPQQKLNAGIKWIIFDNHIFFNSSRIPQQIDSAFSLRRYHVTKEFDFRWIGIKGNIIWQPDARSELAIPDLIYTAALYGRIKIFRKKVTLMPGIDVTYHSGFTGLSYFPATGRYHLTDGQAIPDYLRFDAGIGIHINFLKAFIRVEDVEGLWQQRVLYQADYYPHFPGYIRFGIATGFYN